MDNNSFSPQHHLPLFSNTINSSCLQNISKSQVQHPYGTRKRHNSVINPPARLRDNISPPSPPLGQHQSPHRRIRPLAAVSSNHNHNLPIASSPSSSLCPKDKDPKPAQLNSSTTTVFDFPPSHVVLHPEDANNKVFMAIGRAFMSVNNCAMTVKDLAELSQKNGLICQNVSAAAQAITFFIRSHLHRCEVEDDFPLLLRHVLSGTPRDDELAPALYSRQGGNVNVKDRSHQTKDENGNVPSQERLTCFRRGTTVWYLSKAAGAPCPFARCGIALRDFTDVSGITGAESRKGNKQDLECHTGMKRKREREGLRRRTASGAVAKEENDDDEEVEDEVEDDIVQGRKPLKVKITLRLKAPCLTAMREKSEEASSDSESDSDSDSDSQEETMSVDELPTPALPREATFAVSTRPQDKEASTSSWSLPPFPIQRRISIPPYTPAEETYYESPTLVAHPSSVEWQTLGESSYDRRLSISGVTPPPESDAEDESDDDFIKKEDTSFEWTTTSIVKTEPDAEDDEFTTPSKRSSTTTITMLKPEDLSFNFDALSLSLNTAVEVPELPLGIKREDGEDESENFERLSSSWNQPVDITPLDELMRDPLSYEEEQEQRQRHSSAVLAWKDVELVGPDSICLQDLEDSWDDDVTGDYTRTSAMAPVRVAETFSSSRAEDTCGGVAVATTEQRAQSGSSVPSSPLSPSSCKAEASSSVPSSRSVSPEVLPPSLRTPASPALTFAASSSSVPSSPGDSHGTWRAESFGPENDMDTMMDHDQSSSSAASSPPSTCGPESPAAIRDIDNDEVEDVPHVGGRSDSDSGTIHGGERSGSWRISAVQSTGRGQTQMQSGSVRRRPVIADIPLPEPSTPWERGMLSQWDVEDHLLPSLSPFESTASPKQQPGSHSQSQSRTSYFESNTSSATSTNSTVSSMNFGLPSFLMKVHEEPPLSPQEEEVFQSFCLVSELDWDEQIQMRMKNQKPSSQVQTQVPVKAKSSTEASSLRDVTSTTTSRKTGHARKADDDMDDEEGDELEVEDVIESTNRSETRQLRHRESSATSSAPSTPSTRSLRRSKRVAIATASQETRAKLRKRPAATGASSASS